jgi:ribosome biogenesis GTPase A
MEDLAKVELNNQREKINSYLNTLIPIVTELEPLYTYIPQLLKIKETLEDLQIKTHEKRFLRIPILGVIKAGKSSLINSLLQCDILEIAPVIATKFVLIIRYSEDKKPSLYNCTPYKNDKLKENYVTQFNTEGDPVARGVVDIKNFIKTKNGQMKDVADDENAKIDSFFMMLKIKIPFLEGLPGELRDYVELIDCPGLNDAKARLLDRELLRSILSSYNSFLYVIKPDTSESKENQQTFNNILTNVRMATSDDIYEDRNTYTIVLNHIDSIGADDKDIVINKVDNFLSEKFGVKYNLLPYSSKQELQKYDYFTFLKVLYNYYENDLTYKVYYNTFTKYLEDRYDKSRELMKSIDYAILPLGEDELTSDTFKYHQVVLGKDDLIKFSIIWKFHYRNDTGSELANVLIKIIKNQNSKSLSDILDSVKNLKLLLLVLLQGALCQKNEEYNSNKLGLLKEHAKAFVEASEKYKGELKAHIELFAQHVEGDMKNFNSHFFQQPVDKIKEGLENLDITFSNRLESHKKGICDIFEKHKIIFLNEYKKLDKWCADVEYDLVFCGLPYLNSGRMSIEVSGMESLFSNFHPTLMKYTGYFLGAAVILGGRIVLASPVSMLGSAVFSYEFAKKVLKDYVGFDFKEDQQRSQLKVSLDEQRRVFEEVISAQKKLAKEHAQKIYRDYIAKYKSAENFLVLDSRKIRENIIQIQEVIEILNKIVIE